MKKVVSDWNWADLSPECIRRMPCTYDAVRAWFVDPKRHGNHVASGTQARPSDDQMSSFIISYRGVDIIILHSNGGVELGDPPRSSAAMARVNRCLLMYNFDSQIWNGFMTFRGGKGSAREEAIRKLDFYNTHGRPEEDPEPTIFSVARSFDFIMPARKGLRSDFVPSDAEYVVHVGCRLGNPRAAEMLAMLLRERGEMVMAAAVLENRGRMFECRGRMKAMQSLFDIYWRPSDGGEWLFDLATRKLVRPLMLTELMIVRRDPNFGLPETVTMPDGITYGVAVGADHVGREKARPITIRNSRSSRRSETRMCMMGVET